MANTGIHPHGNLLTKRICQGPVLAAFLCTACLVHGQAVPTATRNLTVAAFAGGSGIRTGMDGARNLSVTAGLDFGFAPVFHLLPSLELRGTYPVAGSTDRQRNVMAGLKVGKQSGSLIPYADLLVGRGQIDFGIPKLSADQQFVYVQSVSPVIAGGIGLDLPLSDNLSFKVDAQLTRYDTPVAASGHLIGEGVLIGIAYRFPFEHRRRH